MNRRQIFTKLSQVESIAVVMCAEKRIIAYRYVQKMGKKHITYCILEVQENFESKFHNPYYLEIRIVLESVKHWQLFTE